MVRELEDMVDSFLASAKNGSIVKKGYRWPVCYALSKVLFSAHTRIQQAEFDKQTGLDLVVNHLHPGFIQTDITRQCQMSGGESVDEGAKSSIYAALLPPHTPIRGQVIWEDCRTVDWETHSMGV